MNAAQRRLVDVTLASLKRDPDAWQIDKNKAKNESLDIIVWLANARYGLSVDGFGIQVGDVGIPMPWRYRVYFAADRIRRDRALRKLGAANLHVAWLADRHRYVDRPENSGRREPARGTPLRAPRWRWPDFEPYAVAPEAVAALAEADPKCSWSVEKASRFLFDKTHDLRHRQ